MARDLSAALDALLVERTELGELPIGYIGVSMGTAYGIPLLASEAHIRAAAIGQRTALTRRGNILSPTLGESSINWFTPYCAPSTRGAPALKSGNARVLVPATSDSFRRLLTRSTAEPDRHHQVWRGCTVDEPARPSHAPGRAVYAAFLPLGGASRAGIL